jgi:hypothetical protein
VTAGTPAVSPEWLALREPADAAARSLELVELVRRALPSATDRHVIHDLGSGTGSMGRWLAPLLPGPQHWIAHDRDAGLLALAAPADGAVVTVETKRTDITRLHSRDLADATLITASALLDMLTEDELRRLVATCADAGCPVLLCLSVTGQVELAPVEALDRRVSAAFNGHQRRVTERGRLLGPDAVDFAAAEFARLGAEVIARPSPWRLDQTHSRLITEWFDGWVGAAREQQGELAAEAEPYVRRRREQAAAGQLAVVVGHTDLLILPRS